MPFKKVLAIWLTHWQPSTVASQTDPIAIIISPAHMASTSQTASSNRQAMTAQPKLQKSLHAPPRNRKLNCQYLLRGL